MSHSDNNTNRNSSSDRLITPSQIDFLDYIHLHGIENVIESLQILHKLALKSDSLNVQQRTALCNIRILWEELENLEYNNSRF